MSETPTEKPKRHPSLKDVGDWAGSVNSIIALVIVVGGAIAAVVTNHFTGFITGGESDKAAAAAKQVAAVRLVQRTPTTQDDQADTYTLALRFAGYGHEPCTIRWQRKDAANSLIDPVARSVRCAGSGAFEQDVRVPVPDVSGGSYRVTFRLAQGQRVFQSVTTKQQFVP